MKTYFGAETQKALNNFPFTHLPVDLQLIKAVALIKMAAADTNFQLQKLSAEQHMAIVQAAKEVVDGQHDAQFLTDSIQGGAGTSLHMNVNEVVASRATGIAKPGTKIHYLDHVNMSQSTNDVVPTAFRVACLQNIGQYVATLRKMRDACLSKAEQFKEVVKVGRTHLQDAVPITLGQEFHAYACFFERDAQRLTALRDDLLVTNLGGTAVGTGITASQEYIDLVHQRLSELSGFELKPAADLIDCTQNVDPFVHVALTLSVSATGLSKICSDLRLLASGPAAGLGEISFPNQQKGSTIMAGKVNPVTLEAVNQIAFQVIGLGQTATLVGLHGQLELNVMLPVLMKNVFDSLALLDRGVDKLIPFIAAVQANEERCKDLYQRSACMATVLNELLGYDTTAKLVQEAHARQLTMAELVEERKLLSGDQAKKLLSVEFLTHPPA